MSLVKIKNKFQITIPTEIRNEIHVKEGDILEAIVKDKTIIFKLKDVIDDHGNVLADIAEGLKDYQEGRVFGAFNSVSEFKTVFNKNKKV
jgi:AbrB family looped-hinge helix DNA binding protein